MKLSLENKAVLVTGGAGFIGSYLVDRIVVFPYWDGSRHYQYTVEVSMDDREWKTIVDMSENRVKATPEGHEHRFEAVEAGFVRVNMLKNRANPAVHIVEFRAYEAK